MVFLSKRSLKGMALAALTATSSIALTGAAAAQAQTVQAIDIPAGELGPSIARLGRDTGVMITVAPEMVRGRNAAGLRGSYTAAQALDMLLAGSGLIASPDGRGGFSVIAKSAQRTENRPAPVALATGTPETATEIIVTGQKIARSFLETQASVAVVTRKDIVDKEMTSFREAFRTMANVMDGDFVDSGFVIRGINSEGLTPGGSPLAAVYIDGAEQTVQGARRGSRGLWDVEQMEVYRGPQSTLSGRAALAGAIHINTRDPGYEYDVAARGSIGEMGTREGALAFGGPIATDRVAFRVSAEYQRRDTEVNYPTYRDFRRYDTLTEDKYYQLRGKLLFDLAPDVSLLLSHAYAYDSPTYDDLGGEMFGFDYADGRGDYNAPYYQDVRESRNHSSVARLTYDIAPSLTLTSLSTLVDTDVDRSSVNAGTPGQIYTTVGVMDERLFTQELRANYEGSGGLQAVFGLYHNNGKTNADSERTIPSSGGRTDASKVVTRTRNYAAFGEITLPVVADINLIAGGRVDHSNRRVTSQSSRTFVDPARPDTGSSDNIQSKETAFLPKLGVETAVTPDTRLGFVAQRGFRPGGARRYLGTMETTTYNPESTWTYEGSLRHSFEDKGSLGFNLFYTDWKDQQIEVERIPNDLLSRVIINAGKSRLWGGELEGRYMPVPDVSTFASVGYVDTKFLDFSDASLGDFSGLRFPESPKWTLAAGVDYRPRTGLFGGIDGKYVGSFLARDFQNAPIDIVGNYFIANARIGYAFDGFSLTLFADNLFDKRYEVYHDTIDMGAGPVDCCKTMGRSRIIGVTAQGSF